MKLQNSEARKRTMLFDSQLKNQLGQVVVLVLLVME